jgi:DNA-binding transcriptional MerR regulator
MPVVFKKKKYYRTSEVCKIVGISRTTLWRWMNAGILEDTAKKDRRGWRIYSSADIKIIEDEAQRVNYLSIGQNHKP